MAKKEELAQLSLYVYDVKGLAINRPALPSSDWEELEYHPDDRTGFSYGVFKNTKNTTTGEVVIAYTGSNEKLVVDFFGTNIPAGVGWTSLQVKSAALAYQQALQKYGKLGKLGSDSNFYYASYVSMKLRSNLDCHSAYRRARSDRSCPAVISTRDR